jgi:hypothetical protein
MLHLHMMQLVFRLCVFTDDFMIYCVRMRLSELEPQFLKFGIEDGHRVHHYVDTLAEADGIMFLCPACFKSNSGPIGTHSVICWFEDKVPDDAAPKPGRWFPTGNNIEDLSFVPHKHSNSVLLLSGCRAHFFVTKGEIIGC